MYGDEETWTVSIFRILCLFIGGVDVTSFYESVYYF